MIVALQVVIIVILLFGAAAVKSATARAAIFTVAMCIGGIGFGTISGKIDGGGSTVLLAIISAVILLGFA